MQHYSIKFRPIRPRSPHLSGKVERSQKTDKIEFYPTINLADFDLAMQLEEWQFAYNWDRPHISLQGKTPMERYCELIELTPLNEEASAAYDADKELFQERNYKVEMQLRKLNRSLNPVEAVITLLHNR